MQAASTRAESREEANNHASVCRARWLVLTAAVLWSTSGFFAKSQQFDGWPAGTLAFWRALFACFVLWPLVRRPRWSWRLIPMTLLFAAMNYSYLTALTTGSAANAIWLQMAAPLWVLLVGVFYFGETAVARDWWLLLFVISGVGMILYFESRGASVSAVGWGLFSGLTYAGIVLSLRNLREFDSAWLAALNHTVTVLCLTPFAVTGTPGPSGSQWLLLAGFGILQLGIPYVLFARGLRHIPGHEATTIGLLEPLLVPIWALLTAGEIPAWWTIAGGGLILLGLAVRYLRFGGRRSPATTTESEVATPADAGNRGPQ